MSGKSSDSEPIVTASDLQHKWEEIKGTVQRQAEQRVMGLSSAALGGVLIGVGVLGLAFWLGRRSARPERRDVSCETRPAEPEPSRPVASAQGGLRLSQAVEPALARALDGAVQLGLEALTKRLRGDETDQ